MEAKLEALGYPAAKDFSADGDDVKKLVTWLEDRKIRHYKIEDRAALRDHGSGWNEAYAKFLKDVECPHEPSNSTSCLYWIISHAICLEYEEEGERCNEAACSCLQNQAISAPEFNTAVSELASTMGTEPTLQSLRSVVERKFNPQALREAALRRKEGKSKGSSSAPSFNLNNFPLGFTTGGAVILKMTYIKDLRKLQTDINNMIVQAQDFTANPKTDAKLGKVGF